MVVAMVGVGALVLILSVIGVIAWWVSKPERENRRKHRRADGLRAQILPLLGAAPQGMRAIDVIAATGLDEEEVRICLGGIVSDGLAHQVRDARATTHGPLHVLGPRPVAADASPQDQPTPKKKKQPRPPLAQGLPERWNNIRLETLRSESDLDQVHDIIHAFYSCNTCKRESVTTVMLHGGLLADFGNVPSVLEVLRRQPDGMGIAGKIPCECGRKMALRRTVLCRTNPTRRNDMHVTVAYQEKRPACVSFLMLDGEYVHLPEDTGFKQVFG